VSECLLEIRAAGAIIDHHQLEGRAEGYTHEHVRFGVCTPAHCTTTRDVTGSS